MSDETKAEEVENAEDNSVSQPIAKPNVVCSAFFVIRRLLGKKKRKRSLMYKDDPYYIDDKVIGWAYVKDYWNRREWSNAIDAWLKMYVNIYVWIGFLILLFGAIYILAMFEIMRWLNLR